MSGFQNFTMWVLITAIHKVQHLHSWFSPVKTWLLKKITLLKTKSLLKEKKKHLSVGFQFVPDSCLEHVMNFVVCSTHLHWCWPQGSVSLWRNPGPLANVAPCQRQRGFETAGLGGLHHSQATFRAIHLSGIIERPILSTPAGVTSYHQPPVPLFIKRGWEDQVEVNGWKKEG